MSDKYEYPKYIILTDEFAIDLQEEINKAAKYGYTPIGGLTMAMTESQPDHVGNTYFTYLFAQMMERSSLTRHHFGDKITVSASGGMG